MPTYAQLQSESWWGREIETPELRWLGDQLCAALGVTRNHFGTKGDNAHLNGGHRSQEWIKNSRWCTNRTYTTASGLSADQMRHIAAFDITPKTRDQMLTISRNLDKVCRNGLLEEIVEWYGNTNNDQRVDGWNNIRNAVASSDSSHLWHLHGTLDRRVLRSRPVMQRVLNALLHGTGGTPESAPPRRRDLDDMRTIGFAKATNGQLYAFDGRHSWPVTTAQIADYKTLAAEGMYNLVYADNPRSGWYEGAFGRLDMPVDADKVAQALAEDPAFVGALAAAVAEKVNTSGGVTAAQVEEIVDRELDEAFRAGADSDA